jgi:hypothetical protein
MSEKPIEERRLLEVKSFGRIFFRFGISKNSRIIKGNSGIKGIIFLS